MMSVDYGFIQINLGIIGSAKERQEVLLFHCPVEVRSHFLILVFKQVHKAIVFLEKKMKSKEITIRKERKRRKNKVRQKKRK